MSGSLERPVDERPNIIVIVTDDQRGGLAVMPAVRRLFVSVNDLVADLFRSLADKDEDQDTLAFFLSDNGAMLGEHGLSDKRNPYTESIAIPMLVHWPGHVRPGAIDRRLASTIVFRELYDLDQDPSQLVNLVGDADAGNDPPPRRLARLHAWLAHDRRCRGPRCP